MQTYRYRFPASGKASDMPESTASMLAEELADSPDCLMAECIFPSDSCIVDHVGFETEGNDVTAVNLYTYTEMWEDIPGSEQSNMQALTDAVKYNLEKVTDAVTITGEGKAMGREGSIPKTLYHITDRKHIADIERDGLVPDSGTNSWKVSEDGVYLCDDKNIAPWLGILKGVDDPVILEINTENLPGVQTWRVFEDRFYLNDVYSEYRTTESIPVTAITEIDFGRDHEELGQMIREQVEGYAARAAKDDGLSEVQTSMQRLERLGIKENGINKNMASEHSKSSQDIDFGDLPWDEGPKPEPYRYRFDVRYAKPGMPMDNQMAPYESGRMEDAVKGTGTKGIEAVRFEQEPDGAVKHVSIYTKGPWNPDRLESHMEKAVSLFNRQSDNVRIGLGQGISCGRSKVEEYDDSFSDAIARMQTDESKICR